jgi:citrate lyase subunit beta/citryl-CoA lyase
LTVLPRSYLYVPGDRRALLDGALARGADALILDLEDAVAPGGKTVARELVGRWLSEQQAPGAELWVRLNSTSLGGDIEAVVGAQLAGVVMPKAELPALAEVDALLTVQERLAGLPQGRVGVLALIETAAGLISAGEIAAGPRVVRLGIGEADLAAELRIPLTQARVEMAPIRLQITVASAAAGRAAPVGPAAADFRDPEALRRSTLALLALGFRARTAIHPAQLSVINDVFTPTNDEVQEAQQLIAAFRVAEDAGTGVTTDSKGRMVDIAVVRAAHEILERARVRPSGNPSWTGRQ